MINSREVIRRLMKYIVFALTLSLSGFTLLETELKNKEIMLIAVVGVSTFCILDLMSPSIHLNIDRKCGV